VRHAALTKAGKTSITADQLFRRSVETLRQRFVEEGFETTLEGKPARFDTEYMRSGTCDSFMFIARLKAGGGLRYRNGGLGRTRRNKYGAWRTRIFRKLKRSSW
jgi:hypothetical protein